MKRIQFLPSLLTLGNFMCGFLALIIALFAFQLAKSPPSLFGQGGGLESADTYFLWACYLIFGGMIFDVLDGRVARMTGTASKFGAELDSLADCVTFGVAPAFLMAQQWMLVPIDPMRWYGFPVVCGCAYAACATLRLARYNVDTDTSKKMYFSGLPSPAAAGAFVTLFLLMKEPYVKQGWVWCMSGLGVAEGQWTHVQMSVMACYGMVLGVLMVTNLRFLHVANRFLGGRARFSTLAMTVFAVLLLWQFPAYFLFLVFNGYVLVSLILHLKQRTKPIWTENESPIKQEKNTETET